MKAARKIGLLRGIAVALLLAHSQVQACGFENPASFALGSLNFAYPNALYIGTAV